MVAAAAAAPVAASAAERLTGPVPARVVDVVDGDTLTVFAHIWLGQEVQIRVRLVGADAPEMHGACIPERDAAQRARAALARLTAPGRVTLEDIRPDKYGGRVLARVRAADGRDLSDELLNSGLAVPYSGGKRVNWCARFAHRDQSD